jgi:hypothetical protein
MLCRIRHRNFETPVKRKYQAREDEFWGDTFCFADPVLEPRFSFESLSSGAGDWDLALVVLCEQKWDLWRETETQIPEVWR